MNYTHQVIEGFVGCLSIALFIVGPILGMVFFAQVAGAADKGSGEKDGEE